MPYYRSVGEVPHKRHTQFRRPDGGLYAEELMGQEGFSSDSSFLVRDFPPDDDRLAAGCRSTIADFTGVPDDANMQYRAGWLAFAPSRGEWVAGIRSVQCFLWLADDEMAGSFKNAGESKLPIHYA